MSNMSHEHKQISFSQEGEKEYWNMVEATIKEVFCPKKDVSCEQSLRFAKELQEETNNLSPLERVIYHDEPINVASDLTGIPVTKDHIRRYHMLAKKMHWG